MNVLLHNIIYYSREHWAWCTHLFDSVFHIHAFLLAHYSIFGVWTVALNFNSLIIGNIHPNNYIGNMILINIFMN